MTSIHLLVIGQSNVANHAEMRTSSDHGVAFGPDGTQGAICDPIAGGSGKMGSIWPIVADLLHELRPDCRFSITLRAVGGTSIEDWAPGGRCHDSLLPALRLRQEISPGLSHVLWHQGERDTLLKTESARYIRLFRQLRDSVDTLCPLPWIICRASYRAGDQSELVKNAQDVLIKTSPNSLPGPDTDLLGEEMRRDNTHFNAAGQRRFAEQLVEILANV